MRVYIDGVEKIRWAIDSNRDNLSAALQRLNIEETNSPLRADIVHSLLSNQLFSDRLFKRVLTTVSARRKNLIVSAMSFMDLDEPRYFDVEYFAKVKAIASLWIAPSLRQLKVFNDHNVRAAYMPLFVDTKMFQPLREQWSRMEICSKYNIPYDVIKDRIVIGSFQRDSLGADLASPKWQKGADVMIDILKVLPKDKFVLLLASPRRHYVINECKKHNLPYYYIGEETNEDDLILNNKEHQMIAELYNLLDLYMITSRLEGGPTAVIEATATKTFVFSTDVGLAPDYIDSDYVFKDIDTYKNALLAFIKNPELQRARIKEVVERQYRKCMTLSSDEAVDKRLYEIYKQIVR